MNAHNRPKKGTNVTLDAETLDRARELGVNVSEVSDAALRHAVKAAAAAAWKEENKEALEARKRWIEENGMPLARWQVLQIPE
ncbi:MAG: type II toxin-antitoxin system CcdA family antitoxin [Pseudomonadota bacterium]